jgi:hypothetical protein
MPDSEAIGDPDPVSTAGKSFAERMRDAPPRLELLIGRALLLAVVSSLATPAEWLVPSSGRPPTGAGSTWAPR